MNPDLARAFGGHAQVVIGVACFTVGLLAWGLGTWRIPGAFVWPWRWQPVAFVFHVSMFYGQVACYAIVSNGLGLKATERVESVVVEQADEVNVET